MATPTSSNQALALSYEGPQKVEAAIRQHIQIVVDKAYLDKKSQDCYSTLKVKSITSRSAAVRGTSRRPRDQKSWCKTTFSEQVHVGAMAGAYPEDRVHGTGALRPSSLWGRRQADGTVSSDGRSTSYDFYWVFSMRQCCGLWDRIKSWGAGRNSVARYVTVVFEQMSQNMEHENNVEPLQITVNFKVHVPIKRSQIASQCTGAGMQNIEQEREQALASRRI